MDEPLIGGAKPLDAWPAGRPERSGPLAGTRVLDLTRILSGPFATMTLGDLGADVIKVEDPRGGDDTRQWGPPFVGSESAYFLSVNRNKRSIAVDLKSSAGLDVVLTLARQADVLVENFRPGTTAKLGIDFERLEAVNPGLVYASVSGYGQDSSGKHLPGYDAIAQAESGLMSLTGEPDGEPVRAGIATADLAAGMWATIGILAALHERERSGRGCHLDVALLDSQLSLMSYAAGYYFATGEQPPRHGSAHPTIAPYQAVATSDGPIMIAVGNDALFARFTAAIGAAALATDPRFHTNPLRVEHRAELTGVIESVMSRRPRSHWLERLRAAGVPTGEVHTLPEVIESVHARERELVVAVDHPVGREVRSLNCPILFAGAAARRHAPPPMLGQHTRSILTGLGRSDTDVDGMLESGAAR